MQDFQIKFDPGFKLRTSYLSNFSTMSISQVSASFETDIDKTIFIMFNLNPLSASNVILNESSLIVYVLKVD